MSGVWDERIPSVLTELATVTAPAPPYCAYIQPLDQGCHTGYSTPQVHQCMISRCHVANALQELKGSKQSDVGGMTGMYVEQALPLGGHVQNTQRKYYSVGSIPIVLF